MSCTDKEGWRETAADGTFDNNADCIDVGGRASLEDNAVAVVVEGGRERS